MERLKTHKNIFDIQFPIFAISNTHRDLWTEDNITNVRTDSGVYVLDNKNIQGDTLGQRRLRIKNSPLYIPRMVVHNISQLIKSNYRTFIDTKGELFTYTKQTTVPLKYFEVVKVVKQPNIGCILQFKNLDNPILVSCSIAYGIDYVGFLITNMGYIEYEYTEERKPNTWRKI